MGLSRLFWRGHLPGADGPHRLIGDHKSSLRERFQIGQIVGDLMAQHLHGPALLPFLQPFANAMNYPQPGAQGRRNLPLKIIVGLAEDMPAFGMSYEHPAAAAGQQHTS